MKRNQFHTLLQGEHTLMKQGKLPVMFDHCFPRSQDKPKTRDAPLLLQRNLDLLGEKQLQLTILLAIFR